MIRDYQEIVSYQKQLTMKKEEGTATVKDIRKRPNRCKICLSAFWEKETEKKTKINLLYFIA
jgi:ribonucleotide reductase alpha subunit